MRRETPKIPKLRLDLLLYNIGAEAQAKYLRTMYQSGNQTVENWSQRQPSERNKRHWMVLMNRTSWKEKKVTGVLLISVLHSPVLTAKIWSSPAVWTDCAKVVRPVRMCTSLHSLMTEEKKTLSGVETSLSHSIPVGDTYASVIAH